jgi:hypothetical protein
MPVVIINALLPFSRWEQSSSEEERSKDNKELHKRERENYERLSARFL